MPDPMLGRLLDALHAMPDDELLWLAAADRLEENGEPLRAELVRLSRWVCGRPAPHCRTMVDSAINSLDSSVSG